MFATKSYGKKCRSRSKINGYADGYEQEANNIEEIMIEPTDHEVILGFRQEMDFEARRRELAEAVERGFNTLKTENIYEGKFLKYLKTGDWEWVTRPNNVSAAVIASVTDNK